MKNILAVTCPCGASLSFTGEAKEVGKQLDDWNKTHRNHSKPIVYRDRWYPTTPYYGPTWRWYDTTTNGPLNYNTNTLEITSSTIN